MQKLTLNDGTVIVPARVILSAGTLWFYIDKPMTLAEAFALMDDPDKTRRIQADNDGEIINYVGYTNLFCIRKEDDNQVNGGLKKVVESDV